jgi:putative hemolysin
MIIPNHRTAAQLDPVPEGSTMHLHRVALLIALAVLLAGCVPIPPAPFAAEPTLTAAPAPAATQPAGSQIANPASVNCTQKGGQVVIVTDAQGAQSGMCVFSDGSQCDEWAFYRDECQPRGQAASGSSETQLQNGQYELPDIGRFQLKDGKFEQRTGEGATQITQAGFEEAASGDLNGDGQQDAVVDLWANTGGTGVFHYLVALLNKDGVLQQAASTLLGDRVKLKRLGIEPNGTIVVDFNGFGPNDPQCCPSQPLLRTYQLEGSALKMASEIPSMPTP